MFAKFATKNRKPIKLCGGCVRWDGRKKDRHGFPVRRQKEVRVWVPCGTDVSDCGAGTRLLDDKLKAKVERKVGAGKRVEVSESWQY